MSIRLIGAFRVREGAYIATDSAAAINCKAVAVTANRARKTYRMIIWNVSHQETVSSLRVVLDGGGIDGGKAEEDGENSEAGE